MDSSKPWIVLLPGAWHTEWVMYPFRAELKKQGYETWSSGLSTVDSPGRTVDDDIKFIRERLLEPLIMKEEQDIVLYLHSYAGFPGSAAIEGFSKQERLAKAEGGGVVGLIYQSAFVPGKDATLLEILGGHPAWQIPRVDAGLIEVADPKQTFYADVKEPLATEASDRIRSQSLASFKSSANAFHFGEDFYHQRRAYIHTINDQALPPFAQDLFVENSGVEWDLRRMATSHSPFLSDPEGLASTVDDIVKTFVASF